MLEQAAHVPTTQPLMWGTEQTSLRLWHKLKTENKQLSDKNQYLLTLKNAKHHPPGLASTDHPAHVVHVFLVTNAATGPKTFRNAGAVFKVGLRRLRVYA